MTSPETGGPAFPRPGSVDPTQGDLPDGNRYVPDEQGMTLRDWFAGQALVGYLAMHADPEVFAPKASGTASLAYQYADAMIAARKPQRTPNKDGIDPDEEAFLADQPHSEENP